MNNTEKNTMLKLGFNLKKFRLKRELTQEQDTKYGNDCCK